MSKKTAFVDTTILTDALLKPGEKETVAKEALHQFEITQLPVYAIKEFKAGPLDHYKYVYNKLATTKSLHKTLRAIQALNAYQGRKASTALEALAAAAQIAGTRTSADLIKKYGEAAEIDTFQCDSYRLALKVLIYKAWKQRRTLTSEVVLPLPCYDEVAPFEKRGQLDLSPKKCYPTGECCLAASLRANPYALKKLKEASDSLDPKAENRKRSSVLKTILRKPSTPVDNEMCTQLGDAVFVFYAPDDAVILTTNIKDHQPLAAALGKQAVSPSTLQKNS